MTREVAKWGVWRMMCRMCRHAWVAVSPVCVDEDNMECPNCGHMTGEPNCEEGE